MPRVSIISPVYNAERYIESCIQSALAQSFADWEQIIVDDGSTDRTAELVAKFADPRIRYIQMPHRGLVALAESYNTALAQARGDLVGILEGDDLWPPDKLANQVRTFDEADVVLSWGNAMVVDESDRPVRKWPVPRQFTRDLSMPELFRVLTRWNVLSPAVAVMVRRSALERIGGFRQDGSSLYVDLPTWLLVSANNSGVARYLNGNAGFFRIHNSNTGLLHNSLMRLEHEKVAATIMADLGPAHLARLGWTARDARVTLASASLSRGIAYFQQGDRAQAREAFATVLRTSRSIKELFTGLVGYSSALTNIDLISRVQRLRAGMGIMAARLDNDLSQE